MSKRTRANLTTKQVRSIVDEEAREAFASLAASLDVTLDRFEVGDFDGRRSQLYDAMVASAFSEKPVLVDMRDRPIYSGPAVPLAEPTSGEVRAIDRLQAVQAFIDRVESRFGIVYSVQHRVAHHKLFLGIVEDYVRSVEDYAAGAMKP